MGNAVLSADSKDEFEAFVMKDLKTYGPRRLSRFLNHIVVLSGILLDKLKLLLMVSGGGSQRIM